MILESNKIYKGKQIAEWFGIGPTTFSSHKKKYLKELNNYCSFIDLQRKGIQVLDVIVPEYTPYSTRRIIEEEFPLEWGNKNGELIDTCKHVADKIYIKRKEEIMVKPGTIYSATCAVKREWYGVSKKRGGTKGHCQYKFVVMSDDGNYYRYFTPEENIVKAELLKKYFSEPEERLNEILGAKKAYKKKEITKEEYFEIIENQTDTIEKDWDAFQFELEERIQCRCARVTELQPCAFSEEIAAFIEE